MSEYAHARYCELLSTSGSCLDTTAGSGCVTGVDEPYCLDHSPKSE